MLTSCSSASVIGGTSRGSRVLLIAFRQPDRGLIRIDIHRAAAVADVGDHLHPHPGAGKARQRDRQQAVVDDLLRVARIQERNADVDTG